MSEPFIGEIRLVSFGFAPKGWATCNGQLLPINQNQALFSILGTTYGGDGRVNFALPDLRGRIPMHLGGGHALGERGGAEAHALTLGQLPMHTHQVRAGTTPTSSVPTSNVWASPGKAAFGANPGIPLAAAAVGNIGGSQPHENRPPFLTLSFCIALQGIFPSPN